MKLLKKKLAVVTGGTGGIGKSIIKTLVKHGAKVIFTFLSSEKISKELELEFSGSAIGYKVDLSNLNSSKDFIRDVCKKNGNIDILVNNAGIIRDSILIRMSEDKWIDVIKTNLYSVFNITKYTIYYSMIKQKKGNIINMSSIVGITGNYGQSNYAASKAGIIGFTKSVAKEFGKINIRCNAIAPGYILTNMNNHFNNYIKKKWIENIPLNRPGYVQEVANCVLFLASDLSSYVTGSVLNVSGGLV
ncbi:3-oxoacyl-ACP reductase FabG [Blattabacterium cuenoti]|uniref:3-oxoacyl-ACP reductase FabG n=1 Tax=Blattabacterium cuenoti TaxID=1653831 RepID=UPI00163C5E1D|nr:3-oxoacyl-ACP reductase FabG [Blattabacterium cuenoti]